MGAIHVRVERSFGSCDCLGAPDAKAFFPHSAKRSEILLCWISIFFSMSDGLSMFPISDSCWLARTQLFLPDLLGTDEF